MPDWKVVNEHHLQKSYRFKDFREAQTFVNRVGDLAEEQGHHPDICFGWGQAEITIWTHKIDGLTESDFILAAKIDEIRLAKTDHPQNTQLLHRFSLTVEASHSSSKKNLRELRNLRMIDFSTFPTCSTLQRLIV